MTQEEKQLLLKDLCARLPYGFVVHRYSDNVDISIDDIDDFAHFLEYSEGEDFKPYLRPMSSMTEKERKHWKNISLSCPDWDFTARCLDWLNAHHFDYRGLIDKGLALEVPEGMYNLKDK